MSQVFDDSIREAWIRGGTWAVISRLTLFTGDLLISSLRERWAATDHLATSLWLAAIPLGLATGYVDSHNNEVQAAVLLIVVFSFAFGLLVPRRAWRWALAIGGSIPAYYAAGAAFGFHLPPVEPNNFAACIAFIPALVGAYSGAFVRWAGTEVAR